MIAMDLSLSSDVISTMFTSWYRWGYPSPRSIKIIDLGENFRQVFGSKGVNLQGIHNK